MASAKRTMMRSSGSMKIYIKRPAGSKSLPKDRGESREKEVVYSDHAMVSSLHRKTSADYLADGEKELDQKEENIKLGNNLSHASKNTCKEYKFGNRSTQTLVIDESLSNLFQHLELAYSGKITSPKWKQFRGMHMNIKDKIRVNNIIWREWHMQYVFGQRPKVCHFVTPLQELTHNNSEAAVVEGYYWKRRLDTIVNEYKHKNFIKPVNLPTGDFNRIPAAAVVGEMTDISCIPRQQQTSHTDLLLNDLQEMMDLSESNLRQSFDFPNPRELADYGYGDFIQQGLLQFQPFQTSFDDFMVFESLPGQTEWDKTDVNNVLEKGDADDKENKERTLVGKKNTVGARLTEAEKLIVQLKLEVDHLVETIKNHEQQIKQLRDNRVLKWGSPIEDLEFERDRENKGQIENSKRETKQIWERNKLAEGSRHAEISEIPLKLNDETTLEIDHLSEDILHLQADNCYLKKDTKSMDAKDTCTIQLEELFGTLGIDVTLECGTDFFPAFFNSCEAIQHIINGGKSVLDHQTFDQLDYTVMNAKCVTIYTTNSLLKYITENNKEIPKVEEYCLNKQRLGHYFVVIVNREMESTLKKWIEDPQTKVNRMCVLFFGHFRRRYLHSTYTEHFHEIHHRFKNLDIS
ncbi:hypothetical protein DPMN_149595 [Dreissena polymorpha]|uniref:Uncharacterized protein n=1 Tax=Dreissena polymorpha TaxID=45954 RepID=A0A9D4FG49_DREPO|nr:hypothetical protein DPMN_149595 [Dreissena polymorpha]